MLATGAGFVPAAWLAVYFSTYASKKIGRKTAIIVATVFTVVAWFVFLKCLGIPIRPFGSGSSSEGLIMDILSNLSLGFSTALTPLNLAYCFAGTLLGTLVGVFARSGADGDHRHALAADLFA